MSYTLIFNSAAGAEFIEAYGWYETQLPGLGERFAAEIEKLLAQIKLNPQTFHFSKSSFREAVVATFPYTIVYVENRKKGIIYIAAIYHSSRNPKGKYRRKI